MAIAFNSVFSQDEKWENVSGPVLAENGQKFIVDTTLNSFKIDLPAIPEEGDWVAFCQGDGLFETNNLVIGRNGNTIMALAEDMNLNVNYISVIMVFKGNDWRIA